jgi:hypothetical protein
MWLRLIAKITAIAVLVATLGVFAARLGADEAVVSVKMDSEGWRSCAGASLYAP